MCPSAARTTLGGPRHVVRVESSGAIKAAVFVQRYRSVRTTWARLATLRIISVLPSSAARALLSKLIAQLASGASRTRACLRMQRFVRAFVLDVAARRAERADRRTGATVLALGAHRARIALAQFVAILHRIFPGSTIHALSDNGVRSVRASPRRHRRWKKCRRECGLRGRS